jgi:hypothetical protein
MAIEAAKRIVEMTQLSIQAFTCFDDPMLACGKPGKD